MWCLIQPSQQQQQQHTVGTWKPKLRLSCLTALRFLIFPQLSLYRFNHSCHFTSLPFWSFVMSSFPRSVHSPVIHKSLLPQSVLPSLIHSLPFFFHSFLNNTFIFPSIEPRLVSIHLDPQSWSFLQSSLLLKVILVLWIHHLLSMHITFQFINWQIQKESQSPWWLLSLTSISRRK